MSYENDYGTEYYESHLGADDYIHNESFIENNRVLAQSLFKGLQPARVLDVGCACGHLVSAFRDLGVEAYGTDPSSYALENVRAEHRDYFCRGALPDLVLPDSFPKKYDLVTCIEVMEHIREECNQATIAALTRLGDTILFSSTPDDFEEPTHINVHPISFWCIAFAKAGFYPDMTADLSAGAPQFVLFRKRACCPDLEELLQIMNVLYQVKKTGIALATERLELFRAATARADLLERELNDIRSRRSYRICMKISRIKNALLGKKN